MTERASEFDTDSFAEDFVCREVPQTIDDDNGEIQMSKFVENSIDTGVSATSWAEVIVIEKKISFGRTDTVENAS